MKTKIKALLLVIILSFQFAGVVIAAPMVNVNVVSEDAKVVFQSIASQAGLNIVIDDSITSRVTISLNNVDADQAMNTVAKISGALATYDNGVYVITNARVVYPTSSTDQYVSQVFDLSKVDYIKTLVVMKAMAPKAIFEEFPDMKLVLVRAIYSEMVSIKTSIDQFLRESESKYNLTLIEDDKIMRVMKVAYSDASEVAMSIQGQLSSVRIQSSRTTNSIILYGPPSDVDKLTEIIKELDAPPALIYFEIEILEIDSVDASNIGIDWGSNNQSQTFNLNLSEASPMYNSIDDQLGFRPWTRSSIQLTAQIKLLQESGKAKILARPSISTLENRTSRINATDRYSVITGNSSYPQYIDAGVQLDITAKIDANSEIVVTLNPKVTGVSGYSKEGYPVITTREISSTVRLHDNETLVIGGLMRTEEIEGGNGFPLLSKIPIIGYLFGTQRKNTRTTELFIMITPKVAYTLPR